MNDYLVRLASDSSTEKERYIKHTSSAIYTIYKSHPSVCIKLFNDLLMEDDYMVESLLKYCKERGFNNDMLKKKPIQIVRFMYHYSYQYEFNRFNGKFKS